ncbi:MAG: RES family NAD+ phosphorylase [Sphingomonadaceae bacterium]|nr:RES family NAD+ phosphorylase [Sphingomonadaceae bacterium]
MWTPSALAPELRPYAGRIFRMVEGQHIVSTNRLTDSPDDQALLEAIIDDVKPRLPPGAAGLHWLLASPFRYGHRTGSRFRAPGEREGIFYAAETVATSAGESAYWRLRLEAAMAVPAPPTRMQMTMFAVRVKTPRALDLTVPPFARERQVWTHASDYAPTQAFAATAREAGAALLRAPSARIAEGVCVPVLDPAAFVSAPALTGSFTFSTAPEGLIATADFPMRFNARYRLSGGQLQVDGAAGA